MQPLPQYLTELVTRYLDVCLTSANAGIEFLCLELANTVLDQPAGTTVIHPGFIARGETVELMDGIVVRDFVYAEHDWTVRGHRYPADVDLDWSGGPYGGPPKPDGSTPWDGPIDIPLPPR